MRLLIPFKNYNTSAFLLISLFGILIYFSTINVHFINDEIAFIQRNEVSNVSELISLFDKKDYDGEYYRPLPNFISGLTTFFFKYEFIYYRIFNFLLHTLAGVFIFFFCSRLLKDHSETKVISLFASLFFLAFPLHDYAVIWHTDLFDRLMLIFYLAGLISFLRNELKPDVYSSFFFLLSLLSKEMAFSFPAVIFLLSFLFLPEKFNWKISLKNALPFFIISILFIAGRIFIFDNNIFTAKDAHAGASIITIIKNYVFFGGMLGFPFFLREVEEIVLQNKLIAVAGAAIIFSGFSFFLMKRRKDLVLIFFILFMIITIAPASRLLMRWYLYLPSVGFTILISYLIFSASLKKKYLVSIGLVILAAYSLSLLHKEFKWVANSGKADALLKNFANNYSDEIISDRIDFLTIPAKVDDIPVFQLGFNFHLNYYLKKDPQPEVIFYTKSVLSSLTDPLITKTSADGYSLQQVGDNYFILSDKEKNIKFDSANKMSSRVQSLFISPEEKNKILFTFSEGRFIKISGSSGNHPGGKD